ncbi:hypothetical protein [Flavobacterium gelatinilyticum]|uniref:hypothetical protein n=1 Tax=Flavobacterium gelatinilyticum TaxID=3003260 RepID=UPI002480D048|nr:hypothetical protein [Flavobacterium gelatinilyticum]
MRKSEVIQKIQPSLMDLSELEIREEFKNIVKSENLPIGRFSYEVYLGGDILFEKQNDTGLWNITVYKRLEGTPLERLMVISAFASIKRIENIWYKDDTSPFDVIGPEIQNEFHLNDEKSKQIAEEVLCYSRNSLHYMFEADFLLQKKYLSKEDVTELAKYYQSISMMPLMLFQFLACISALKKHGGDVTEFNEHLISIKRYELLQIIDVKKDVLDNLLITKKNIKDIFNLLYPDIEKLLAKLELEKQLKEIKGNEKCFILTEDSKSNNLTKVIFESNGFKFSETTILSYESCSQIGSVNLFSTFIKQKFPHITIIVHRDRDYLTNEEIEKLQVQFSDIGVYLFITKGTDIESHYVNSFHVNKCYPEIEIEEADQLIEQSFDLVKEKSIDLFKKKEFGEKYKNKSSHLKEAIDDLYLTNKFRFSHGKSLYKALKSLIQIRTKKNPNLEVSTEFLKMDNLLEISNTIWK